MDSDDCKPAFRQKQTTIRWGEGGAVSYAIVSILSINAALWEVRTARHWILLRYSDLPINTCRMKKRQWQISLDQISLDYVFISRWRPTFSVWHLFIFMHACQYFLQTRIPLDAGPDVHCFSYIFMQFLLVGGRGWLRLNITCMMIISRLPSLVWAAPENNSSP